MKVHRVLFGPTWWSFAQCRALEKGGPVLDIETLALTRLDQDVLTEQVTHNATRVVWETRGVVYIRLVELSELGWQTLRRDILESRAA